MSANGVNFSTSNLPKQWQYVKRNLREMGILNQAEEEYEHAPERVDIRSGTYPRVFTTTFGKTELLIPKVRKKSRDYVYKLFSKYQRRQQKFDDMIVLSLLLGFSTRKQQINHCSPSLMVVLEYGTKACLIIISPPWVF